MLPNIFNSSEDFSQWFNKPFESNGDNSPDEVSLYIQDIDALHFHFLLFSFSKIWYGHQCLSSLGLTVRGGEPSDYKPASPSSATICTSETETQGS